MSGISTDRNETASAFPSYSLSPSGSKSSYVTMDASYTASYSTSLSESPSNSPIHVHSQSAFKSSAPLPTPSQTSTSLTPLAPPTDNVTVSRQELIYIGAAIGFVILVILSCTYNAYREKKRLNKLLTRYTSTPSTIKVNPVVHNSNVV